MPVVRLLAFPHAGAGASAYHEWGELLGPRTRLVAMHLPGREDRFLEPPATSVVDMLATIETQWLPQCRPPYAVFGHSVGALAAFELVREIRRRRLPLPMHLVVSGRIAPQEVSRAPRLADLADDDLVAEIAALGGTPAAVLADTELRTLLLPQVRADLHCDEDYQYRPEPPLPVPMTVLGGSADARAPWAGLAEWSRQTMGPCVIHLVPGGHFFVCDHLEEVVLCVRAALEPAGSRPIR